MSHTSWVSMSYLLARLTVQLTFSNAFTDPKIHSEPNYCMFLMLEGKKRNLILSNLLITNNVIFHSNWIWRTCSLSTERMWTPGIWWVSWLVAMNVSKHHNISFYFYSIQSYASRYFMSYSISNIYSDGKNQY